MRTISLLLLLPLSTQAVPVVAGTHVPMRLQHTLSTRTARVGDTVHLRTVHPLLVDSTPIPSGSYVQGVVVRSDRPGRVRGRAALEIGMVSIVQPDGSVLALTGRSPVMEPPERQRTPFAPPPTPVVPIMAGMAVMYGTAGLLSSWRSDSEDAAYEGGMVVGLATGVLIGVLKRGDHVVLRPGSLIDVMVETRP